MAQLPAADWLAPTDFAAQNDRLEMARQARARDTVPKTLTDKEIAQLISFLGALTGASIENGPLGIPQTVPSGLPVDN
tara:strand:+ start:136 stop:369 length:234 start_codon:yes stop_codon:yes gene_type:complete